MFSAVPMVSAEALYDNVLQPHHAPGACWAAAGLVQPLHSAQAIAAHRLAKRGAAGWKVGWNRVFDATYVINLWARPDRRAFVARILEESNASDYTFFMATNSSQMAALEEVGNLSRWVLPAYRLPHADGTRQLSPPLAWTTDRELWPPNASTIDALVDRVWAQRSAVCASVSPLAHDRFWTARTITVGNPLGMAACFDSHLRVMLQAEAAGHRAVLVVEDDVTLLDDFHARFYAAVAALPDDWDILNLGWPAGHPTSLPSPCSAGHKKSLGCSDSISVCRVKGRIKNLAAYAVSRRALRWLIPLLQAQLEGGREGRDAWRGFRILASEGRGRILQTDAPGFVVATMSGRKQVPEQERSHMRASDNSPPQRVILPVDLTLQAHLISHPEVNAFASTRPLVAQLGDSRCCRHAGLAKSDIGATRSRSIVRVRSFAEVWPTCCRPAW